MMKRFISEIRDRPRGWLVLLSFAAALHVVVSTGVFVIGRLGLMPSQFDRNGWGKFASDSYAYQQDIMNLTDKLIHAGAGAWLKSVAPWHVRLYSLSHSIFRHWTSPNVLTIEPLNLFYYLAILFLVFKLGERLFDRLSGALAMTIVALWPSFLLHTTQLLRDPLLILAILVFVLVISGWLTEDYSYRRSAVVIVPAVLAVVTIWIVRLAMWDIVRMVMTMGLALLVLRLLRERRLLRGNIINAVVLIGVIILIPLFKPMLEALQRRGDQATIAEDVADLSVWDRIALRRQGFANLKKDQLNAAASNIDEDVQFNGKTDVILYLPRACAIGLLAPFPNLWFVKGSQVGSPGRLLSGGETLLTYVLELLALISLWQMRKNLAVWLLVATVVCGVTALGLIVLNIGAFYRLRYPYWMLIVVLGTGGAIKIMRRSAPGLADSQCVKKLSSLKSNLSNQEP